MSYASRNTQASVSDKDYLEAMMYVEDLCFKFFLLNSADYIMMPSGRLLRWRDSETVASQLQQKAKQNLEHALSQQIEMRAQLGKLQ